MTTQIGRANKAVIYSCLLLSLLFAPKPANAAAIIDDINNLAENVKLTANIFMQESFDLRLKYQYNGCFLNDPDRQNLYALATKAAEQLEVTGKVQRSLKSKIENYQGSDWENKYGKTGLWRKLVSDLYVTTLNTCGVDYYRAIVAPVAEKNKILLDILTRMDSLDKSIRSADAKLLKAKTTAQLARTELAYKPSAIHLLNSLVAERNVPETICFHAAIEKINFLGNNDPEKVDELLNRLAHSSCRDDLELVLSLAFFQRQKDPSAFEKTVEKWPQAQNRLAPLILGDVLNQLADRQDITQISTFEAELAVLAAWKNNPQNYTQMLEKISSAENFRTPLILYVTAVVSVDAYPRKSVDLLIRASKLQQTWKNSRLDIEPQKIAEQAAKLAYNLFLKDSSTCALATETFRDYSTIAADKTDIQLEYFYSSILNQCGQPEKAKELLKKIAAESDSGPSEIWHKRAALDLVTLAMSQAGPESAAKTSALDQLASFVADCPSDNNDLAQLHTEAVTMYAQLLLEAGDAVSAQNALDILNDAETGHQTMLTLLKSKALLQLDNFAESSQTLLDVNDPNSAAFCSHAMELLSRTVEKIDSLQGQGKTFQQTIQNCKKISQVCYSRLSGRQKYQAGAYLMEITLFSDENQQEKISLASKLLSELAKDNSADLALVRCRARLLAEQGKFEEAADFWSQIANALESALSSSSQHADRWWQAKFFELYCAANVKKIPKTNITHSIEVLESSFVDIPPLWSQKLKLLKQKCLADISNN